MINNIHVLLVSCTGLWAQRFEHLSVPFSDITVICPWEAFNHLELHELAQYGIIWASSLCYRPHPCTWNRLPQAPSPTFTRNSSKTMNCNQHKNGKREKRLQKNSVLSHQTFPSALRSVKSTFTSSLDPLQHHSFPLSAFSSFSSSHFLFPFSRTETYASKAASSWVFLSDKPVLWVGSHFTSSSASVKQLRGFSTSTHQKKSLNSVETGHLLAIILLFQSFPLCFFHQIQS